MHHHLWQHQRTISSFTYSQLCPREGEKQAAATPYKLKLKYSKSNGQQRRQCWIIEQILQPKRDILFILLSYVLERVFVNENCGQSPSLLYYYLCI